MITIFSIIKIIRNLFLRKIVYHRYKIGKGFHAGIRVRIWAKKNLTIGDNFYIGRDSFIECDAFIGNNVMMANRVALIGKYDHNYQQIGVPVRLSSQIRDNNYNWKGLDVLTIIEDDVWIGYGCTILGGVKIGEGSIIAAGSLVTKDIEPYSIYGGSPARKMSNRFESEASFIKHLKLVNSKYQSRLLTPLANL